MCIIIFHIYWRLCVHIDIKSANNSLPNWHIDEPYWNHVSILSGSYSKVPWDSQNSHVTLFWGVPLLYKVIKVTIGQAHHHWWKSNVCRRTTEESRKDALDICLLKPRCCVSWLELFDYVLAKFFVWCYFRIRKYTFFNASIVFALTTTCHFIF